MKTTNEEFIKMLGEKAEEIRKAMCSTLDAIEQYRMALIKETMQPFELTEKHNYTANDRDFTEVYELIPDREINVGEAKSALTHVHGVKEDDIRISGVRYFTGNQDALSLKVERISKVGSYGRYTYTIYATYDK